MGGLALDQIFHWPFYDKKKSRTRCKMPGCSFFTHIFCTKCEIHLCLTSKRNCFYSMHNVQITTNEKRQQQCRRCCNDDLVGNSDTTVKDWPSKQSKESSSDGLAANVNKKKRKLPFDSEESANSNGTCTETNDSSVTPAKKTKHNSFVPSSFAGVFSGNKW